MESMGVAFVPERAVDALGLRAFVCGTLAFHVRVFLDASVSRINGRKWGIDIFLMYDFGKSTCIFGYNPL